MDIIFNEKTHLYEIDNYDNVKVSVTKFIESKSGNLLPIIDEETYKAVRKARTKINGKLKEIAKFRKQTNAVMLGNFNTMSKSIERTLQDESNRLTVLLEAYKPSSPIYEFSCKTSDKEAYDKLVEYAKKLGIYEEETE